MVYKLATYFGFLYKIKMQDFLFHGHYFKNVIIKQQLKYKDLLNVRFHTLYEFCAHGEVARLAYVHTAGSQTVLSGNA